MSAARDLVEVETLGIQDWLRLSAELEPTVFAEAILSRFDRLLPVGQRNAAFSWLPDRESLTTLCAQTKPGSPLAKVPYVLKDLFPLAGVPTRAGSRLLEQVLSAPEKNAHLVETLASLGAVCAGKTQLHEFAYGLTGQNPHYGDCLHPSHPDRTTGGSSSGSALAVAAGLVPFSLGTDTGGSVRVPSAFCGLYGYRHIPHHPTIEDAFPLSPRCDTAGWFCRNPQDLLLLTTLLLGTSASVPRHTPRGCFLEPESLEPGFDSFYRQAASGLCPKADPATADLLFHAFAGAAQTYTVLTSTEACAVHSKWLDTHQALYSPTVWSRIDRGRHWSSEELATASTKARFLTDTLKAFFLSYDFLVLPSAPCPALRTEDCDRYDRNKILELNAPASLAGLPVVALPFATADGLSGGLQVILPSPTSPVLPWLLKAQA